MSPKPCIEHVGVWATWDGLDSSPAEAEICIRVHPIPNTRIPILQYSVSNVLDVDLQKVIRLEHPLAKEIERVEGQKTPLRGFNLDGTPDTEKIERKLIGSPIHGPSRPVRRHIFPKKPKSEHMETYRVDTGFSKSTTTVLPPNEQSPPAASVDSAHKAEPLRKRPEQTPWPSRENQRSLRDDIGPLLSVVEDTLCPENVSFVVLPEDKRFVSGSTAEIFLPSRSCSPDNDECSQRRSCDGTTTPTVIKCDGRRRRGAVTVDDSVAMEARRKLNKRMSQVTELGNREKGGVSYVRALSVLHNPSTTPSATQGAKSSKPTSSSKKAPWLPPAIVHTPSWSKASTSPGKGYSPRGFADADRRSVGKKKGQDPSSSPMPVQTFQQGKGRSSDQLCRTVGRKSGKPVDRSLDGPSPEEREHSKTQPSPQDPVLIGLKNDSTFPSPTWTFYEDHASPSRSNAVDYASPTRTMDRDLSADSRDSGYSIGFQSGNGVSKGLSLESRKNPDAVMTEENGTIYATFPPDSKTTPLQLEFAVKLSIKEIGRENGRLFEIRGLPWHQGATSRAAFIISKEFDKDGVRFYIPNFNERFLQVTASSVIGNFDLRQPLQLYFRKANEIPTHMAFDTVVETYSRFTYNSESGITAHYKLILYLHGQGDALLDILNRKVCTTYTIRNGPEDSTAYSIAGEGKDCQKLAATKEFDDNHGRYICIISEAADVGCPITIEFDMNLGNLSESVRLPFIMPTAGTGRVVAEMMAISELPFPMNPEFKHDASVTEWVYAPYPASPTTPAVHKFFRVNPPSVWDNAFSLQLSVLKEYRLDQIGGYPDSLMPSPSSLELNLYIPPERTGRPPFGCGMILATRIWGNLMPPEMIEFQPNGWQLSSAWVDGVPAGRWQFYETPSGGVAFLLKDRYWVGSIIQLRLHWILVDSSHNFGISETVGQQEKYGYKLPYVKVDHIAKVTVKSDVDNVAIMARNSDGETSRLTTKRDCSTSLPNLRSQVPDITIRILPSNNVAGRVLAGEGEASVAAPLRHPGAPIIMESVASPPDNSPPPPGPTPPNDPIPPNPVARSWWDPRSWGMPSTTNLLIFVFFVFYVANWSQFRLLDIGNHSNQTAVVDPSFFGLAQLVPGSMQGYFGVRPSVTRPSEEVALKEVDYEDWEDTGSWPPRGAFTPFAEYVPYDRDAGEDDENGNGQIYNEGLNESECSERRVSTFFRPFAAYVPYEVFLIGDGEPKRPTLWPPFQEKIRENALRLIRPVFEDGWEESICGPSCSVEDIVVIRYLSALIIKQEHISDPFTEERRQAMIEHIMNGLPL